MDTRIGVLPTGTRIGPYEITGWLGAGGMGDVYRARDDRLSRDVAIKLIASSLTADPGRVHRFEQEARATGQLTHPNILAVHDVGTHDGTPYLVSELLEGESLRRRLQRGAVPPRKALDLARQIAEGLAAAHDLGIVHRDVKPENVFVTSDGRVKILDFGIAKLTLPAEGSGQRTGVATHTLPGTVIGSVGYMSPEQVRGEPVDQRSDIFNVGAILHEMLAGRAAFARDTAAETMAAILTDEPPEMPPDTVPPALARIIARCLEKTREARFQSARDLAFGLEVLSGSGTTGSLKPVAGRRRIRRESVAWTIAALAVLAALAVAIGRRPSVEPDARSAFVALTAPPGASFAAEEAPVIAPDGGRVAFVGYDASGTRILYTRAVYAGGASNADGEPIAGSEGASLPFWSPDSASLGFFAQGKLKTVHVASGRMQTLAPAAGARGGTWNRDNVIVFVPSPIEGPSWIAAGGGTATHIATDGGPFARGWFPSFLPDGRHFLVFVIATRPEDSGVFVASLDSPVRTRLVTTRSNAVYAAPGQLLYWREGALVAQPFDARTRKLTGAAAPVPAAVGFNPVTNQALFSTSESGTLVFFSAAAVESEIVWVDRGGAQIGPAAQRGISLSVAVSPDATQAVYDLADARLATLDLWRLVFARGVRARLTFNPGADIFPVWSADGTRIAYASVREGPPQLYALDTDGQETRLLTTNVPAVPSGWSPDGKTLIYTRVDPRTSGGDIWALPLGGGQPAPVLTTDADERNGTLSPDGRWLAYVSNESGRYEIYVRPFVGAGALRQISIAGGLQPEWRRDGRELFYLAPDRMLMAVETGGTASFDPGPPRPLFATHTMSLEIQPTARTYSSTIDGRRFLLASATRQAQSEPIRVVLNWPAALRR